jgi:DNA-binding NtrC family response regulator
MLVYETCRSGYQREVQNFKKQLLQTTLEAHHGNRTHAARALGLQRTYLLRLMRDFEIRVPHG